MLYLFTVVSHEHEHVPAIITKVRKYILDEELKLFRIVSELDDFLELFEGDVAVGLGEILSHDFAEYFLFEGFGDVD
jgi:hypothetical protein